jgi:hypothetical protein
MYECNARDITCQQCGNPFQGRLDANYCSPACRQKAYRSRNTNAVTDKPKVKKVAQPAAATTQDLEEQIQARVHAEVQRIFEQTQKSYKELADKARMVVEGRKGILTQRDYKLILSCLHPDGRLSASDEKLARAFRIFNEAEILFLNEADDPSPRVTLPTTVEELKLRRRK